MTRSRFASCSMSSGMLAMPNSGPPANQTTLGAIPSVTTADRIHAIRRARALPRKPQQPCDVGLFSDDAAQLDLLDIEMFQQPVEGA